MLQRLPTVAGPGASSSADADPVLRARVQDAAQRFEGLFIHQMLKTMRQSGEALAGDEALFRRNTDNPLLELADQLVADNLAGQRAFGIADLLTRQLLPDGPFNAPRSQAALSEQKEAAPRGAEVPPWE